MFSTKITTDIGCVLARSCTHMRHCNLACEEFILDNAGECQMLLHRIAPMAAAMNDWVLQMHGIKRCYKCAMKRLLWEDYATWDQNKDAIRWEWHQILSSKGSCRWSSGPMIWTNTKSSCESTVYMYRRLSSSLYHMTLLCKDDANDHKIHAVMQLTQINTQWTLNSNFHLVTRQTGSYLCL